MLIELEEATALLLLEFWVIDVDRLPDVEEPKIEEAELESAWLVVDVLEIEAPELWLVDAVLIGRPFELWLAIDAEETDCRL